MQRIRRTNPLGFGNLCRPIAARKASRLAGFWGERRATLPITDSVGGVRWFGGVCLKNTSAQLHTVAKSGSNGTSAALQCLDQLQSARVTKLRCAASAFTRVARFECRAAEGRDVGRQDKLQTCSKATQVPKLTGERGGFARKRSVLFSFFPSCSKERYAAGHVNLKEITARHNNDSNRCPVFLRLSPDLPVVPVELLTVR